MRVQTDSDDRYPGWLEFLEYLKETKSSNAVNTSSKRDRDDRHHDRDKDRDGSRRHRHGDRHRDKERDGDRERRRDKESRPKRDTPVTKTREEEAEERIRDMSDGELERALQKLNAGKGTPARSSEDVEMRESGGDDSSDDGMIGPFLPGAEPKKQGAKPPNREDMQLKQGMPILMLVGILSQSKLTFIQRWMRRRKSSDGLT